MSYTLCTSEAIIRKAGANANSTAIASAALLADFADKAEGQLCMKTRKDWVSSYAVTTNFRPALADAVSDLAAMKVINYDMSGYTSRLEAQTMLDVLKDNSDKIIADLKEKTTQEAID
jgi:hypothetical protein